MRDELRRRMYSTLEIPKQVYEDWMEKEGIPVYYSYGGVEDITELPRRPWARLGGKGTFIELEGTKECGKLMYVAEIPPGGALEPERHLYDELLYIVQGRGLAEVWHQKGKKRSFEWGEGSLFATPLNAWHRLVNGGQQPVLVYATIDAPVVMAPLRDYEFIFNCDYNFTDRFRGEIDYFAASEKWSVSAEEPNGVWETNFIPDLFRAPLGGPRGETQTTNVWMAAWTKMFISEWAPGSYTGFHYHRPGAILLRLASEGYAIMWDRHLGIHPYQDGHGDKVVRVNVKKNSIYVPPNEWFHGHFNTGRERARHLAIIGGGSQFLPPMATTMSAGMTSVRKGGWRIEPEDQDPEVYRMFVEECRKNGVKCSMKPIVYRTDPFKFSF